MSDWVHHPDCWSAQDGSYHTGDCISGCGPYPSRPPSGYPKPKEQVMSACRFCGEEVDTDLVGGNSGVQAFLVGEGQDTTIVFQHTKCVEDNNP